MNQEDASLSLTSACPVCAAQPPAEPCQEVDGTPKKEPHAERLESAQMIQEMLDRMAREANDAADAHARADAWARGVSGVLYGG